MSQLNGSQMMRRLVNAWIGVAVLALAIVAQGTSARSYAEKISSLIDPAKLATLGSRGANPRVQKYVALLAEAKAAGEGPTKVAAEAVRIVGMKGQAAKLTSRQMVRNLKIAETFGCLEPEGLARMRRGGAPKVTRGKCKGDELSVDHIIPRQVVPELDNVIANLELMPLRLNEEKNASIGKRQVELAVKLEKAGLVSKQGMGRIVGREEK